MTNTRRVHDLYGRVGDAEVWILAGRYRTFEAVGGLASARVRRGRRIDGHGLEQDGGDHPP